MSRRLVLGDTIIDADNTLSTNTAWELKQHPDEKPGWRFAVASDRVATLKCRIRVSGDDDDDTQDNLDDLLEVLMSVRGREVKLEYATGKKRYALPLDVWTSFRFEGEVSCDARGAYVDCIFTSDAFPGSDGSDTGQVEGALTGIRWDIEMTAGGLVVAIGTVTFRTRTLALGYKNLLESGGGVGFPAWMESAFRYYDSKVSDNDAPASPIGAVPCTLTIQMRQMNPALLGISALQDAVFADYTIVRQRAAPTDADRGVKPGWNVLISGVIQWKVERAPATLNASDGAPIAGGRSVENATEAAIDAIVKDAETRTRYGLDEVKRDVRRPTRSGEVTFEVYMLQTESNSDIVSITERTKMKFNAGRQWDSDYLGRTERFDAAEGMTVTMTHEQTIVAKKTQNYMPPMIASGNWDLAHGDIDRPVPDLHGGGFVLFTMKANTEWRRVIGDEGDVIHPPGIDQDFDWNAMQKGG